MTTTMTATLECDAPGCVAAVSLRLTGKFTDFDGITAEGWVAGPARDYCPAHAFDAQARFAL